MSFAFGNLFLHPTTDSIENFGRHSANLKTNLPQSNASKLAKETFLSTVPLQLHSSTAPQFASSIFNSLSRKSWSSVDVRLNVTYTPRCPPHFTGSSCLALFPLTVDLQKKKKKKAKKQEQQTDKCHAPFWYLHYHPRRLFAFATSVFAFRLVSMPTMTKSKNQGVQIKIESNRVESID